GWEYFYIILCEIEVPKTRLNDQVEPSLEGDNEVEINTSSPISNNSSESSSVRHLNSYIETQENSQLSSLTLHSSQNFTPVTTKVGDSRSQIQGRYNTQLFNQIQSSSFGSLGSIDVLTQNFPLQNNSEQPIQVFNVARQTIPPLNTIRQTIPPLNTIRQKIPPLNTIRQKIPPLNTIRQTIKSPKTTGQVNQEQNVELTETKKRKRGRKRLPRDAIFFLKFTLSLNFKD
ncbi:unnamed protein product, partial [Brachionus calyciflorus]